MTGTFDRLLMIAIIAMVLAPLELLWPARNRPGFSWRRYSTDVFHVVIGGTIIRIGTISVLAFAVPISAAWSLPLWAQVAAVLLISDFMFYIAHRLFHVVPLLWEFHKVHHSSEHLDWLAAYRVHPVDQILNASLIAAPAIILGFSPLAMFIYAAVYQWHSILLHSNIRAPFGPVGKIIVSSRFHRWHHANEREAHDRNFGGQLAIWDRLFGTHYEPEREPIAIGVSNPPPENFLAHIIGPFIRRKNAKLHSVR